MFHRPATALTHKGVMAALQAAIAKAEEMAVPQDIVIVDASGETLAKFRMDGAKFTSMHTATSKAICAVRGSARSLDNMDKLQPLRLRAKHYVVTLFGNPLRYAKIRT